MSDAVGPALRRGDPKQQLQILRNTAAPAIPLAERHAHAVLLVAFAIAR